MSGRQAREARRYTRAIGKWRKRARKPSDWLPNPTGAWNLDAQVTVFYAPRRLRRSVHRMYRHHREGR